MRKLRRLGFLVAVALAVYRPLYGDLRERIIDRMDKSHTSIDLVVYEIRAMEIVDALIDAKHRGVRVRVIVDSVHSPVATAQEKALEEDGVAVRRINGSSRNTAASSWSARRLPSSMVRMRWCRSASRSGSPSSRNPCGRVSFSK